MAYIDAFGKVYPCPFLPISVGSIKKDSFEKIWESSDLINKLQDREYLLGKCGRCKYRNACGGCRAEAFNVLNDVFETDPGCWKFPARTVKKIIAH